jgi:MYXO-CTERM domain-containing protein
VYVGASPGNFVGGKADDAGGSPGIGCAAAEGGAALWLGLVGFLAAWCRRRQV